LRQGRQGAAGAVPYPAAGAPGRRRGGASVPAPGRRGGAGRGGRGAAPGSAAAALAPVALPGGAAGRRPVALPPRRARAAALPRAAGRGPAAGTASGGVGQQGGVDLLPGGAQLRQQAGAHGGLVGLLTRVVLQLVQVVGAVLVLVVLPVAAAQGPFAAHTPEQVALRRLLAAQQV